MPPPITATGLYGLMSLGFPKGPTMSRISSPTSSVPNFPVDTPTSWKISVISPFSLCQSTIVSGNLSPLSSVRSITNCPGLAVLAIAGALTLNSLMWGARCCAAIILFKVNAPLLCLVLYL